MGVSQQSLRTGGGESELKEQQTCERTNQGTTGAAAAAAAGSVRLCVLYSFGRTDRRLRRSAGCETRAAASSFSLSRSRAGSKRRGSNRPPACLPADQEAPPPRQLLTWPAELRCLHWGSSRKVKHFETRSACERKSIQCGCLFVCLFHGVSESQCGAPLRLC